ncbi:DUF4266 domain-containing protein [Salinibius halmophilus]|uniref:DUF4266 domain-containing protein n=1 Tax=Salinibius halmophilus TaxID=1853216 RepID=UPI001F2E27B2|nr:DUF4266 domain-containing protein [Salinibius halmophilus]
MMKKLVLVIASAMVLTGCATVQPWERNNLAKQEMLWTPNPVQARFDAHVYGAKETAFGGMQAAGGGCGCN